MIDVFAIALLVLSCLLAPADAERILIDRFDTESGRLQTMTARRTPTGFEIRGPKNQERGAVKIVAKGKGRFVVSLPGGDDALPIDLSGLLKALDPKLEIQTHSVHEGEVRISRSSGGLTYLVPQGRPGLFVIRSAPPQAAAKAFKAPATKLGQAGDFKGWEEFVTPWELTLAQARQGAQGGHGSPAQAAFAFFASVMRRDAGYLEVLSPKLDPALRERMAEGLLANTADLVRVIGHAQITKNALVKLEAEKRKGFAHKLEELFGAYDSLMFCEGNTSATDVFVVFEEIEGKWYVKGVSASFTKFLRKE